MLVYCLERTKIKFFSLKKPKKIYKLIVKAHPSPKHYPAFIICLQHGMNQYTILSTTTAFVVDSSTTHHNNQEDVLTAIIKAFLWIMVFGDSHLDIACTIVAIWTLLLLGDQTVRSDGEDSEQQSLTQAQSSKASINNVPTSCCLLVVKHALSSPQSRRGPGTARRATVAGHGASPQADLMSAQLLRTKRGKQTTNQPPLTSPIIPFLPTHGVCHSLNRGAFANYNLDAYEGQDTTPWSKLKSQDLESNDCGIKHTKDGSSCL